MMLTRQELHVMRVIAAVLPNLTFDFKRFYDKDSEVGAVTITRILDHIDALEKTANMKNHLANVRDLVGFDPDE